MAPARRTSHRRAVELRRPNTAGDFECKLAESSMLAGFGLGAMAVTVGKLFGPLPVLSRFTNMVFGGGLSQLTLALVYAALRPAALVILIVTAPSVAGAFGVRGRLRTGLRPREQVLGLLHRWCPASGTYWRQLPP